MLGFVSLFMDMSSEMAHAVLPIFLTVTLGTSVATVGFIDGVAEAVAQVMKLASGSLSDALQSRKWLAVLGYGLSDLDESLLADAAGAESLRPRLRAALDQCLEGRSLQTRVVAKSLLGLSRSGR